MKIIQVNVNCKVKKSDQRSSTKKVFLKILQKFTGKHMCQSIFLKKVSGLDHLRTPPSDCFCKERRTQTTLFTSQNI